ncbi:ABC transporter ATP-binding protein [Schaalia meyeri]|uniref:ABC transporter ATP-binding protein n=1 Tax=Schaalia meyeri TaxID=52773 RepID=A0AAQ0BXS5_9ACTO|nr:ABC transporter ATP-binding protein [Schaalia meyeri]QQC44198.1 ABC transporter ATP-binding protein [Schaalia meyeri]SDR67081.1 energy-coupling factor transport system ATP-binding protein [Schaalia meyeri]
MIRLEHVSFHYRGGDYGVTDINLRVPPGACVVLCGASGCGKTTLTRLINGLAPRFYRGTLEGAVRVGGKEVPRTPSWEITARVGSVFQDPSSQFFSSELPGEVAFACENLGMPQDEVRRRTDAAIATMALECIRDHPLDCLSSGEKQRVAIASVCAPAPKTLVFDEPTANLDAEGERRLARIVRRFKDEGFTQIIAEHRLAWLDGVADLYVRLENGRILEELTRHTMRSMSVRERQRRGLRSPTPVCTPKLPPPHGIAPSIHTVELACKRGTRTIWEGLNLRFFPGRITAITGGNGVGKTSLGTIFAGLSRPSKGSVFVGGKKLRGARRRRSVWFCSNDTGTQFFTSSVTDELLVDAEPTDQTRERTRAMLKRLGLYEFREAHPASLSGGQRQRLAIACALLSNRNVLIFDEPTSGVDDANMTIIARELAAAAREEKSILVITHDNEFMAACCDSEYCLDGLTTTQRGPLPTPDER